MFVIFNKILHLVYFKHNFDIFKHIETWKIVRNMNA